MLVVSLPSNIYLRYHDRRSQCRNSVSHFPALSFFLSACRIKLVGRHISKSFVQGSDMQCSLPSSCIKLVAQKQHCRHVVQNEDKKDAHPPTPPAKRPTIKSHFLSFVSLPCTPYISATMHRSGRVGRSRATCCHHKLSIVKPCHHMLPPDPTRLTPTRPDPRRPAPTRFDPTPTRPTEARPNPTPTRHGDDPWGAVRWDGVRWGGMT